MKIYIYLFILFFFLILQSCNNNKGNVLKKENVIASNDSLLKPITIEQEQFTNRILQLSKDSTNIFFKNKDSILSFYKSRDNKPAWTNVKDRIQLHEAIKNSFQEGLNPDDYRFSEITKSINNDPFTKDSNIAIDLLFTDIYLAYAYDLANGKTKASDFYDDWVLETNVFLYNSILNNAINNNKILNSFEVYKPTHKNYGQLKKILSNYKEQIEIDTVKTTIAFGNKIRPNKSDVRIIRIRKRLTELKFIKDTINQNSILLDSVLQESIKAFQKEKNLSIDAIVGTGTITELNKGYEDKYKRILVNLERWKWFPRNFGEDYILVNIPDFKLKHYTKEDTTEHTVVVGKFKRKTPVFSAPIKYVVFNPKWHIPPTIKKEDIIPSARKNPSSLTRKNISVFNREGKRMQIDSIQWDTNAPSTYSYVQGPGRSNALGLVKIIFPNKHSVFLHDTNHRNLFKKNFRAISSGCVRVKTPFKLTSEVLKWNIKKVDSAIASKETKRAYLKHTTMVYMLYWDVIFDINNNPTFISDVYNLDDRVSKALLK